MDCGLIECVVDVGDVEDVFGYGGIDEKYVEVCC